MCCAYLHINISELAVRIKETVLIYSMSRSSSIQAEQHSKIVLHNVVRLIFAGFIRGRVDKSHMLCTVEKRSTETKLRW